MYEIYKDKNQNIEVRIEDLLSRMTVEEKIGQLTQLDGRVALEKNFNEQHPGSFLQLE